MITDNIVSYELASYLREKEFNEPCVCRYVFEVPVEHGINDMLCYFKNSGLEESVVCAPTLQDVSNWLLEKHNLCIYVFPLSKQMIREQGRWEAGICYADDGVDATVNACGHIYGKTYKDCWENAIYYCLLNDFLKKTCEL